MRRDEAQQAADVVILASGYATDEVWITALRQAVKYGRQGIAVDREGREMTLGEALAAAF